jgi:hypothetical protein
VHGSSEAAPTSWRDEFARKVAVLAFVHRAPYAYATRGGGRIVFSLGEPYVLRSQADARQWARDYAIGLAYLARRFDIHADPACADWTRLFRLPRATRDVGGEPENWAVIGDASSIAELSIHPTRSDVETAKRVSKAFGSAVVLDFEPTSLDDGAGVLYQLLAARNSIFRRHSATAYVIRCPNESAHSGGRTGDGSTLLYLPARGEHVGAICCKHAHCAGLTVRDWVRMFTAGERAGIQIARRA